MRLRRSDVRKGYAFPFTSNNVKRLCRRLSLPLFIKEGGGAAMHSDFAERHSLSAQHFGKAAGNRYYSTLTKSVPVRPNVSG